MKLKLRLLIIALILFENPTLLLSSSPLLITETAIYKGIDTSKEKISHNMTIEVKEPSSKGLPVNEVLIKIDFDNGSSIREKMLFEKGKMVKSISYERQFIDSKGNISSETRYNFGKDSIYPQDSYPPGMIKFILRYIQYKIKDEFSIYVALPDSGLIKLIGKVECIEDITVPAGTFRCYKVKTTPDSTSFSARIGPTLGALIYPLIPSTYSWISTDDRHILVKREGEILPPPNDQVITHELVSLK